MALQLFNTLSRSVVPFSPTRAGEVRMYSCGPTVYAFAHIGNLKTFTLEDLLKRILRYKGYRVHHVRNLTDVDDKTIRGAQRAQQSLSDYTQPFTQAFLEDMERLNNLPAEHLLHATQYVPQMIDWVKRLIQAGYAYESADGVYFRIQKWPSYGKLALLQQNQLLNNASGRAENESYTKEELSDFVLWKKWDANDGDIAWESPFGKGRPGWHLECSVLARSHLGDTIDIHTGGMDLIFPHHTNESAQVEALTHQPFAQYWVHVNHLLVDGKKMSKSQGNFYTLRDLLSQGFSARAIRYALLATHYRKPLNFTLSSLDAAQAALDRIDAFRLTLQQIQTPGAPSQGARLQDAQTRFLDALYDDLNLPEAMGVFFEFLRQCHKNIHLFHEADAQAHLTFLDHLDSLTGFFAPRQSANTEFDSQIHSLLNERKQARAAKNFAESDRLRETIEALGVELRDTPDGQVWRLR